MRDIPKGLLAAAMLTVAAGAAAQAPPLAPTTNTTIPTSAALHYSSIQIPAGVTVQFTGTAPAIVICDGNARIDGTLSVAPATGVSAAVPGETTAGEGSWGSICINPLHGWSRPATNGRHAGLYGTVLPFSLAGGSPGGGLSYYRDLILPPFQIVPCGEQYAFDNGGHGGGTLVLLAGGRIEVAGLLTADAGVSLASVGSGGSVLLRGMQGVDVLAQGTVSARGASGGDGYIRLDSFGAPPVVHGPVLPAPTLVELPLLRAPAAPAVGTTWQLETYAPAGDGVLIAVSLGPGGGAVTPFGPLGIDLATAVTLAFTSVPNTQVDPQATVAVPIPNAPSLVGLPLWVQGIDAVTQQSPRLTNTLAVVIS